MQTTNIRAQKINGTTFETYRMEIAAFLVIGRASGVKFFEKTFLVANFSSNVIFEIFFLILSGADINFLKKEL